MRYAIADVAAFVEPGGARRRRSPSARRDRVQPRHAVARCTRRRCRRGRLAASRRTAARRRLAARRRRGRRPRRHPRRACDGREPGEAELRRRAALARRGHGRRDARAAARDRRLLQDAERARGGASLGVPPSGGRALGRRLRACGSRRRSPSKAGTRSSPCSRGGRPPRLMMRGGVGVLRTMPPPDPRDVARLRRVARALDVEWPDDLRYGDLLHTVDARRSTDRGRVPAGGGGAVPGRLVHRLRRRGAARAAARRDRRPLRALHGAAPPTRRSLRPRGVPRALRGA